jgi:steroid 5-alpha reductase family enzyme
MILGIAVGSCVLMLALWEVQRRRQDAGIVDAGWALGLAAVAVAAGLWGEGHLGNRLLVAVGAGIWGLRLGIHLLRDRIIGKPEDGRYQAMRTWMGRHAQPGFLLFFQMQAGFILLFGLAFVWAAANPEWSWIRAGACAALWAASLAGAWIADAQLAAFRADPSTRGQVCVRGLWRYSRHPNYFFEWLHWWGWAILATPATWWGFLIVAVMLLFLLKLTGIPHVEARALRSRGDAYRAYQRSTSAFIPWFPRVKHP